MKRTYRNEGGILVPDRKVVAPSAVMSRREFMRKAATIGVIVGATPAAFARRRFIPKTVAGPSYLFLEDWEGSNTDSQGHTGYNNTGWTANDASISGQYNTAPAPLLGSFSGNMPQQNMFISRTLTGITTGFYCFWYGNYSVLTNFTTSWVEILDSLAVSLVHMEVRASGAVRLHCGASNQDTANGLVTASTTAYFWLEYENNGGATSVARLYISANTTKPAASVTTVGTTLTNADNIKVRGTSSTTGVGIYDHFIYNGSAIGSAP